VLLDKVNREWPRQSIFRRKPVPDLIRDVQRFAAENATKPKNLKPFLVPQERERLYELFSALAAIA
jgi:hypothetical protein